MPVKNKSFIHFFIDTDLLLEDKGQLLIRALSEEKIKYSSDLNILETSLFLVIFTVKSKVKQFSKIKNKIIILDSAEDDSSSFEKINLNSFEEITQFLEKIFYLEKRLLLQEKLKDSEVKYENIKKINQENAILKNYNMSTEQQKDLDALLDLEMTLLQEDQRHNWNLHFKNFTRKHSKIIALVLLTAQELAFDNTLDEHSFLFSLSFNDLFLVIKFKSTSLQEIAQPVELILTMVLRTLQLQDQHLIKSDGEIDFWKKIFSKIPYPMAVISDLGDLLIYNESFAKIGILPKECLGFKDQDRLELFKQFYKVSRINFYINLMDVSYFVFYTLDERFQELPDPGAHILNESRKAPVDELGIISSSIAHELNNPLAGILAAISLLSLEDDWSAEDLADLNDMKNGAKRCKELVEIFLGFSKFSPTAFKAPSIKQSLDQALNLLRFRMIESNLRLEIHYVPTLEMFSYQINSSIMSMILYLIISELMTCFAHERLITQIPLSTMSGEVLEFSNQIVLKLDHDFEYEEKLAQSKLIQHLLIFEKLEINFLRKEIRLIYK